MPKAQKVNVFIVRFVGTYQLDMRARILNLVGIYGAAEGIFGMTGMLSGTPCAGKQTKHEFLWR